MSASVAATPLAPSPWGNLRLTPSNSPFAKTSNSPLSARSPIKSCRPPLLPPQHPQTHITQQQEPVGLSLRQVIGTTTASANGLDSLACASSFAFTAGGAAVIATVDRKDTSGKCSIRQRFYRARPNAAPLNPTSSLHGPSTPVSSAALEGRNRVLASLRDGAGASPYGSPGPDWAESPSNKTWSARERVKAATCVSFSPDGKYLAVGETGYKPRVLVFSTSPDVPSDMPMTSLSEHTFGVKSVAFSPDSQYLASLGCLNDGFLFVWHVGARTGNATLHSTNKCTANVNHMIWLGKNLVTVGTRHVKLWRIDDQGSNSPLRSRPSETNLNAGLPPANRALPGRNCLLGPMLETTFTCAVAVSSTKAIVCSDQGDICLLDAGEGNQKFSKLSGVSFAVGSVTFDSSSRLHCAGAHGKFVTLSLDELICSKSSTPSSPLRRSPTRSSPSLSTSVIAMSTMDDLLVTIDTRHAVRLLDLSLSDTAQVTENIVHQIPGHGDAVRGVSSLALPNSIRASFFTFSSGGRVLFWNGEGNCVKDFEVQLDQSNTSEDEPNEVRVVRVSEDLSFLVSGDRHGVLRISDCETGEDRCSFKTHASEITDIALYEGEHSFIATSGRDRMIQIFERRDDAWELMQTLDEHVGAVTGLLFSSDGKRLMSSSSDRTVVVREAATMEESGITATAFVIARTLTLKASPISMTFHASQTDRLLVSTMDRFVHKFDVVTGQCITTFKASDSDSSDAVVISSLVHIPTQRGSYSAIAGVSSTDKSIRLYEDNGNCLSRDWGHTEGVTDIALVATSVAPLNDSGASSPQSPSNGPLASSRRGLVTVAADGTIFIWDMQLKMPPRTETSSMSAKALDLVGVTATKDLLAHRPPIRRVLSQSELARFQRFSTPNGDDTATNTPAPSNFVSGGAKSPKIRKRPSKAFSLAQAPRLDPSPMSSIPRANTFQTTPVQDQSPKGLPPSSANASAENLSNAGTTASNRRGRRTMTRMNSARSPSPPSPRTKKPPSSSSRTRKSRSKSSRRPSHEGATARNARGRQSTGASSTSAASTSTIPQQATAAVSPSESGTALTEALCRQLRAFRRKLGMVPADAATGTSVSTEAQRELQRELDATAKLVGERAKARTKSAQLERQKVQAARDVTPTKPQESGALASPTANNDAIPGADVGDGLVGEAELSRMLERYSERMMEMLENKMRDGMVLHGRGRGSVDSRVKGGDEDGSTDDTRVGSISSLKNDEDDV